MNQAPLLAAALEPELGLSPVVSERLGRRDFEPPPDAEFWRSLVTPIGLEEFENGRVGLLRVPLEAWRTFVGAGEPQPGGPRARTWMEAARLGGEDVLVYPNDESGMPSFAVYAPVRLWGGALLFSRLVLRADAATAVEPEPCTALSEGRLREREVVCVDTGCGQECGRTFYTDEGVEILECSC